MTSNLGAEYFSDLTSDIKNKIKEVIQTTFRPEFVNRIDDIIAFNKLSQEHLRSIAVNQLTKLSNRIYEDIDIQMTFDASVIAHISKIGENHMYGARPIKRKIQSQIENELSKLIISDQLIKGASYNVSMSNGKLLTTLNQKQIQSNPSS